MIDFELNKKDDVTFRYKSKLKPLRIQFAVSDYPALRIQFSSDIEHSKITAPFKIKFYTDEPVDNSVSLSYITGNAELAQNIKIALQTELGELANDSTFGSELYTYKHSDITDKNNLNEIASIAEMIASDIIGSEVTANVIVENNEDAGYFYGQNVTIYLYTTTGNEICRFTL